MDLKNLFSYRSGPDMCSDSSHSEHTECLDMELAWERNSFFKEYYSFLHVTCEQRKITLRDELLKKPPSFMWKERTDPHKLRLTTQK